MDLQNPDVRIADLTAQIERNEKIINDPNTINSEKERLLEENVSLKAVLTELQNKYVADMVWTKGYQERHHEEAFDPIDRREPVVEAQQLDAIQINEQQVMDSHYKQIADLNIAVSRNKRKLEKIGIPKDQKERHELTVAQGIVADLEPKLERLQRMQQGEVIRNAKMRRKIYDNARKRYQSLSFFAKLKYKVQEGGLGKLDAIFNNPNVNPYVMDGMYQKNKDEGMSL